MLLSLHLSPALYEGSLCGVCWYAGEVALYHDVNAFIHFVACSKVSSPDSAICWFHFQFPVASRFLEVIQ